MDEVPQLLTVKQVAAMMSCSPGTIYRLLQLGLPSLPLTPGGDRRFDRADVIAWIESRKAVQS